MIRKPHRKIFVMILIFCCIFLCIEMSTQAATEDSIELRGLEERFLEESEEKEDVYFYSDRRYVRLYIDESHYAVIDLAVVLGILVLLFLLIMMRGYNE